MKALKSIQQSAILGLIGSTVVLTPVIGQALTVAEVINPREANSGWLTYSAP